MATIKSLTTFNALLAWLSQFFDEVGYSSKLQCTMAMFGHASVIKHQLCVSISSPLRESLRVISASHLRQLIIKLTLVFHDSIDSIPSQVTIGP